MCDIHLGNYNKEVDSWRLGEVVFLTAPNFEIGCHVRRRSVIMNLIPRPDINVSTGKDHGGEGSQTSNDLPAFHFRRGDGKPDSGKNRLYEILIMESAHLI